MGRQLLLTYVEAERIFSLRKNEGGGKDYYIKWKNLPYAEARTSPITCWGLTQITGYLLVVPVRSSFTERITG